MAKILIVEDSPDIMKLFRTVLTLRGHAVVGLPGGAGLLETIGREQPAIVLMDIQLPGRDGFTLLGEIRSSEHRALTVVALTAHAMSGDRERALQAGFDDYITKPIDIRSFPEQVQAALAGRRARQPRIHDGVATMTPETGIPASSPKATPEKKALLEAFDTVLKTQAEDREAERAAAEAQRRNRGAVRLLIVLCTTIIVFTCVYLYVERPEFVFPTPLPPESVAVREASLRISLASAAQHIERYQQQTGQLPTSLGQAGAHGAGITYERTPAGYRLQGDGDGVRVTFTSGQSLTRFIGKSFDVIARRTR